MLALALLALVGVAPHAGAAPASRAPWFVDASASSGLSFRHHAARSPRHFYPETFGAGVALFDLDGDGDLDVLLLDTGAPPGAAASAEPPRHALLRNDTDRPQGPLVFTAIEAPLTPGIAALGACVGDVDGDGDADVYVTGLPHGLLLLSEGGRLMPAPAGLGAADPGWSTSCVFIDHDRDGDLDLFVGHYVRWRAADEVTCGGEVPGFVSYCPPDRYQPESPRLFAGDGHGRFTDVSAGIAALAGLGKTLGVVAADLNEDGWADLVLANDQVANGLLLGGAGGTFSEAALVAGIALSEEGKAQAGMGTDVADADGDGDLDITIANLDLEANNLYLALAAGRSVPRFRDAASQAGLGASTLMALGFGAVLADLDGDGDADLFYANGHVIPEITLVRKDQTHAMEDQLFENVARPGQAPLFSDARAAWLPAAADRRVSRGLAAGDLDSDGDLDLIVTENDGPARLLRNDSARTGRWIGFRLLATRSAPGAPCARVVLERADGGTALGLRRTGGSYLSSGDERVLFGLASAPPPGPGHQALVAWPSGLTERFGPLPEGHYHPLTEGRGSPP